MAYLFKIGSFDGDAWAAAAAPFGDASLPQSWAYGESRASEGRWRVERGLFSDGGESVGAAQVMVRALPVVGGGLAWISRGPMWRRDDALPGAEQAVAMLSALRRHYVTERGMYLRIAPAVEADSPLARELDAAGFQTTETGGWASAALDLARDLDALRAGLEQKWRNALNKAERLGIAIERGEDDASFGAFLAEYRAFLSDRGFATTVTPALLAALQKDLPETQKLIVYRARHEGAPVGSVLISRCGPAGEYLAGTSPDAGRGLNAGQLLLWQAVCDLKDTGYRRFDVGGLDPEQTPAGIFHFKNGLGGTPYRYVNEIEADASGWRARLVRWRVGRARAAA